MRVLFAGPTVYDLDYNAIFGGSPHVDQRPPAAQGDIARAVLDGATAIALIDGRYEDVAAPWHKEILFALERGVPVIGGGSLGALRAAECAEFGMIGIGRIFEQYVSGELVDDSDIAQLHAPSELGSFPLTEALVNVSATIDAAGMRNEITADEMRELSICARNLFFKELTFENLARQFGVDDNVFRDQIYRALINNKRDVKREDALAVIRYLVDLDTSRVETKTGWKMSQPATWRRFRQSVLMSQ